MKKFLPALLLALACVSPADAPAPTAPEPMTGGSGLHAMSFMQPVVARACSCPSGYTEYTGGNFPGTQNGYGCWKCYDNHNDPPQPSNSCGVAVGLPVLPCGSSGGGSTVAPIAERAVTSFKLALTRNGAGVVVSVEEAPSRLTWSWEGRVYVDAEFDVTTCEGASLEKPPLRRISNGLSYKRLFPYNPTPSCECPETWTLAQSDNYRVSSRSGTYDRCPE